MKQDQSKYYKYLTAALVLLTSCVSPDQSGDTISSASVSTSNTASLCQFETVDDGRIDSFSSRIWDIHIASNGDIFAVGDREDSKSIWSVRKSSNRGASWQEMSNFVFNPSGPYNEIAFGVATDSSGSVYVAGRGHDSSASNAIVRKSEDGGETWQTVETFDDSGNGADSHKISVAPNDDIYLAAQGRASNNTSIGRWVVRKSADLGSNWSTVDDIEPDDGAHVKSVSITPGGEVLAVGFSKFYSPSSYAWMIRRGQNQGVSWSIVDEIQGGLAYASATSEEGVTVVVGHQPEGAVGDVWMARRSEDGEAWEVSDSYRYPGANRTVPIAVTAFRNHFFAFGNTSNGKWVVRVSRDGGKNWKNLNVFETNATPRGIAVSPRGEIYLAGSLDLGSRFVRIVRRGSCNGL